MRKRAIFFDIDGTLWDHSSLIPDSASRAIREMKAAGHAVLICSGRSRGYIFHEALLSLGFDGFVSAAGACVDVYGKTLLDLRPSQATLVRAVVTARAYRYGPMLEGNQYMYMERDDFIPTPYIAKLYRELGERLQSLDAHYGNWPDVPKMSMIASGPPCPEKIIETLQDEWDFIVHTPAIIELTPKGVNKGTGLTLALSELGIPREDSVAFGDSANDLPMFREAGLKIAMGNGAPELKAQADHVTTGMYEDGIWNAWQWLKAQA